MVVAGGVTPDVNATEDGVLRSVVVATIGVLPDVDVVGILYVLEDPAAVPVPCPQPVVSNE